MMKGFYNLTSGMASQQNRLNVVANNMTNISTAGYKAEHYTDRTFDEVMVSRIGNIDKSHYQTMETYQSHILAPDHLYTDFIQGSLEETNLPLDFAIQGEGFFAIQTVDGVAYTRAGSFTLDNEGYLCLSELGRVLDREGNPSSCPPTSWMWTPRATCPPRAGSIWLRWACSCSRTMASWSALPTASLPARGRSSTIRSSSITSGWSGPT